MPAIDPSFLTTGPEWSVGAGPAGADAAPAPSKSFGAVLQQQLGSLQSSQAEAAVASRQLADGTAADPSAAVMAVERARLSMQLASQIRNKGVEAITEVLRTQV